MLKRWLGTLALLLAFNSKDLWAAQPADVDACVSALAGGTGNWTTAGTWTGCGGTAPDSNDTCTISTNDTVLINGATPTCGPITINSGGLLLGPPTTAAAPNILTLVCDATVGTTDLTITGTLRLRKNSRLAFNTDNGAGADVGCRIAQTPGAGGNLDAQGEVFETTIAAITAADGDATCGTTGRMYTITPAAGIGYAQTKGRVVFESGPGETRQLEISRAPTATSFVLCTDFPDASSGTDTTGGQRLTPHANFAQGCTGAGTPIACCTGAGAGATCHSFALGRHSTPILGGVLGCSANGVPNRCCTGVDAGTCTGSDPVVGDKIAIIQDVWFYVSAATDSPPKGYYIALINDAPVPVFRAVNFANAGVANAGAGAAGVAAAATNNATVARDFVFNNYHDGTAAGDQVTFRGLHDFKIWWNAIHDGRLGSAESSVSLGSGSDTTCGATCQPNNVDMSHNIFYRSYGMTAQLNAQILIGTRASGDKFIKNIISDGCTTLTGECGGLQVDLCDKCVIANNLIFDMTNGNNLGGQALFDDTGLDSYALDNWVVNLADQQHAAIFGSQSNTDWFAVTHNYVSNVMYTGITHAPAYSNVIKNKGLVSANNSYCIENPVEAKGNYCQAQDVNDTAHYNAADCDLAGDFGCGFWGINLTNNVLGNGNKHKAVITDNLILGPFGASGTKRGINGDGTEDMDFSADIDHNIIDARGSPSFGIALSSIDLNPSSPTTVNMRDNVGFGFNNNEIIVCSSMANITDNAGTSYISTGVTTPELVFAGVNGTCTTTTAQTVVNTHGAFRDRAAQAGELSPDYNWLLSSSAVTAGLAPVGSPMGVRVLRFNCDRLKVPWSNQINCDGSMPVPICNDVRCNDADSDGVPDLLDNCPRDFNPSQYDSNSNGVGDACGG